MANEELKVNILKIFSNMSGFIYRLMDSAFGWSVSCD